VLFFLLVNSSYFWADDLGMYSIPVTIGMIILFLVLFVFLLKHCYFLIKEKFSDKRRLITVCLLTVLLSAIALKPGGMINFDGLAGNDLLIAQREGAANCLSTFKLKSRNNFTFRQFCFGSFETNGKYALTNDTIFFKNVKPSRADSSFYEYAVIKAGTFNNGKIIGDLYLYKNTGDTSPYLLSITLNDLPK